MLWAPRQLETNYYGVCFDVKTWLLNNQHGQHWWVPYVISGTKDYFRWFDMFLMGDNDTYLYYDIYFVFFCTVCAAFCVPKALGNEINDPFAPVPRQITLTNDCFSSQNFTTHFTLVRHRTISCSYKTLHLHNLWNFSVTPDISLGKHIYQILQWLTTHTPSYVVIAYCGSISKPAPQLTRSNMSVHLQSHLLSICSWSPLPVCSMSLYDWQLLNYDNEPVVLLLCNKN